MFLFLMIRRPPGSARAYPFFPCSRVFGAVSSALPLAEAGHEVNVLEADEPGFGAAGRNTGFAVPMLLTGLDPRDVKKQFGEERGTRVCRTLGEGGDLVFELIRRHGIDCQARQSGWMQPIQTPAKAAWLDDRVGQWTGQIGRAQG